MRAATPLTSALGNLRRISVEQRLPIRRLAREVWLRPVDLDPRQRPIGPDVAHRPCPACIVQRARPHHQNAGEAQRLVPNLRAAFRAAEHPHRPAAVGRLVVSPELATNQLDITGLREHRQRVRRPGKAANTPTTPPAIWLTP